MLKVFLPANDIISDFLFARNLFKNEDIIIKKWFTFFAYYFIAWPGVMLLLSFCGSKYLSRYCHASFFPCILIVFILSLQAVIFIHPSPQILLPVAIFVSGITIIVGVMDVFFHGPAMKKLSSMITCYEGRFESAFQLIMHLVLLIKEQDKDNKDVYDYYGILSSLLMLCKDLSENILINGSSKSAYQAKSFPMKIMAMARLFPAILLIVVFRLETITRNNYIVHCSHEYLIFSWICCLWRLRLLFAVNSDEQSSHICFFGIISKASLLTLILTLITYLSRVNLSYLQIQGYLR